MGCFYSKVGPPRAAFSRDLSLSIKKRIADYPPFEDLLSTRAARADHRHLFSLFYSIKLKPQEPHSPSSSSDDPSSPPPETINAWELMADLDDPQDQDPADEHPPPPSDHPADPGAFDPPTHLDGSPRLDLSESEQRSEPPDLAEPDPREGDGKGSRRRAAALRLKLKAPSFDFHSAGEVRPPDGEEEQAEPYETPKFGRYGRRRGEAEEEEEEVFEAELVAEIEAALERLTEEEEDVLRRIVEECMLEAGEGD